jgi:pimeloyl-ACP methyl ester carboxylesterase
MTTDAATDLAGHAIVLVHGAYHGGWCWSAVADTLRAAGSEVHAPTLPGLRPRKESPAAVGLEDFIVEIANLIIDCDLRDVLLVGHSFGGIVISGVVDRMPERIASLVYLDALVLADGERAYDVLGEDVRDSIDRLRADGEWALPVPQGYGFGVDDGPTLAWLLPQISPHPIRTYLEPLSLRAPLGAGRPGYYLDCVRPASTKLAAVKRAFLPSCPFPIYELPTGHDAMVSAPQLVSAVLSACARGESIDRLIPRR